MAPSQPHSHPIAQVTSTSLVGPLTGYKLQRAKPHLERPPPDLPKLRPQQLPRLKSRSLPPLGSGSSPLTRLRQGRTSGPLPSPPEEVRVGTRMPTTTEAPPGVGVPTNEVKDHATPTKAKAPTIPIEIKLPTTPAEGKSPPLLRSHNY